MASNGVECCQRYSVGSSVYTRLYLLWYRGDHSIQFESVKPQTSKDHISILIAWWCTPAISAPGRWRREGQKKLKASLGYTRSCFQTPEKCFNIYSWRFPLIFLRPTPLSVPLSNFLTSFCYTPLSLICSVQVWDYPLPLINQAGLFELSGVNNKKNLTFKYLTHLMTAPHAWRLPKQVEKSRQLSLSCRAKSLKAATTSPLFPEWCWAGGLSKWRSLWLWRS